MYNQQTPQTPQTPQVIWTAHSRINKPNSPNFLQELSLLRHPNPSPFPRLRRAPALLQLLNNRHLEQLCLSSQVPIPRPNCHRQKFIICVPVHGSWEHDGHLLQALEQQQVLREDAEEAPRGGRTPIRLHALDGNLAHVNHGGGGWVAGPEHVGWWGVDPEKEISNCWLGAGVGKLTRPRARAL